MINRLLFSLFLLLLLSGCLSTKTAIYQKPEFTGVLPEHFALVSARSLKVNQARSDTRLEKSYSGYVGEDGRYTLISSDVPEDKPVLLTVGGKLGNGYFGQTQAINDDGSARESGSYFYFLRSNERIWQILRADFDARPGKDDKRLEQIGIKIRPVRGIMGTSYFWEGESTDDLTAAFAILEREKMLKFSDWVLFDLSQKAQRNDFLEAAAFANLPNSFVEKALGKSGTGAAPDLTANRCLSTRYDSQRYQVRVSNRCDFRIEVEHCEQTKSESAGRLLGALLGSRNQNPPIPECRSYVLQPGGTSSFTFVRDLSDTSVPGVYRLQSPLSYSLTATRRGY